MNIAIASCFDLPDWEKDDVPFFKELADVGIEYQVIPWDSEIDWSQFDACLLRTTWDYQERIDEFMSWINHVSTQAVPARTSTCRNRYSAIRVVNAKPAIRY